MSRKHVDKKGSEAALAPAQAEGAGTPAQAEAVNKGDAPSAPQPPPEPLDPLKAANAKAAENWDKLLRATADFENYKKRVAREKQEAVTYANVALFQKLLPVLDNFEMAQAAAGNAPDTATQSLQAGVAMIASQLRGALVEAGLEEIDAAGKLFDPNFHEAVAQQESADVPEGHVLQQLRKGYKMRDRLLRPASVIVARKPSPPPEFSTTAPGA
jgi:molecular chaperone GrpE